MPHVFLMELNVPQLLPVHLLLQLQTVSYRKKINFNAYGQHIVK